MRTGVWSDKHGVTNNAFGGSNFEQFSHMFVRLKESNPDYYLASVSHWGPINDAIVEMAHAAVHANSMEETESAALDMLAVSELDGLFAQLDEVEHAGHTYGFDPSADEYLDAIEWSDEIIGNLVDAIENRPTFTDEEWLIVVSTDHGGIGTSHGGASFEERNIFSSLLFPNEELSAEYETWQSDPSNALNLNQSNLYGTRDSDV